MQHTAQALSGSAFGALADEHQHVVKHILQEAEALETLLKEITQTIGLLNIGQRYYLHGRFHRHLTPILQQAQNLQQDLQQPLTQPQLACVQTISDAAWDLHHNIDNLWVYSRIQNGKVEPIRGEFDVEHLLRSHHMMEQVPDGAAIQLETRIPEDFPYIRGDLERTREAFRQVLQNAIHFTQQGHVRVTAVTGNNRAKIRVADNGRGIPREHHTDIFRPFFQLNTEDRGMGLGLAIARALMELQDGALTVESTVGVGTTFTLALPTAQQK